MLCMGGKIIEEKSMRKLPFKIVKSDFPLKRSCQNFHLSKKGYFFQHYQLSYEFGKSLSMHAEACGK